MSKSCQNCQKEFEIRSGDQAFYQKISVPEPTFCPDCRQQRRLLMRNERVLYARKCDAPGHDEMLISPYHPDLNFKIVDPNYWYSDQWDPFEFGRDYDFSKPFFEQLMELRRDIPRPSIITLVSENCDFANMVSHSKNCYLVFSTEESEDCYYGSRLFFTKECVDCEKLDHCELCYECFDCAKCYNCLYGEKLENCRDTYFCFDCRDCSDCFGCNCLRNKQYCWFNEQLSADEYKKRLAEAKINTRDGVDKFFKEAQTARLKFPHRYAEIIKSENSTGNKITNSQNIHDSFSIRDSQDVAYTLNCTQGKDTMDAAYSDYCENIYENMSSEHDSNKKFCCFCWECHDVEYSEYCHSGCSDLFGCVGIHHGQYCILNKRYSKDEYEALKEKIIKHMDEMPYTSKSGKIYKYGEYFPSEFSTFGYNETVALEFYPLTKEAAVSRSLAWREPEARKHEVTITPDKLPTSAEADQELLKHTISCAHTGECNDPCTQAFKIVGRELEFYKKMNLPLPTLCPMCRHFRRVRLRSPLRLWHRKCMNEGCDNEFETTYSPDRSERVFCEDCYLNTVG